MRLLHTSDLHLGRSLHGVNRDATFEKLLAWLLDTLRQEAVDCLIVSGDVFDNATPSHRMQRTYYRFLASIAANTQCRHVVITAGNHDSPSLLEAPDTLLEALNIHVVGRAGEDPADETRLLKDAAGNPEAVVIAVPYLRESDLRTSTENETQQDKESKIRAATAAHYRRAVDAALLLRGASNIPVIACGHLFAAGCEEIDEERSLYVGSLGLIPADAFPAEIDYLALGHLHKPQCLAGIPTRRYSGSPLVLDFSERNAVKSICLADFSGRACNVRTLPVPAFDTLVRIEGSEAVVRQSLARLVEQGRPVLCEVRHNEGIFAPDLASACRDLVQDSPVTLVRVISQALSLALLSPDENISDVEAVTPQEMFELFLRKQRENGLELDDALRTQLVEAHAEILNTLREAGSPICEF